MGKSTNPRDKTNQKPATEPVVEIKTKADDKPTPPTPEMQKRVRFELEVVIEAGQVTDVSHYRRKPMFETLAAGGDRFTPSQMAAMRHYRQAFDRADRSYTTSCLDFDPSGARRKPDAIMSAPEVTITARDAVAACERAMGIYRATVAAVVLDDRSFSEIAIERFGSRKQSWIQDEPARIDAAGNPIRRKAVVEKIVPKSGRHREIIRQEFVAGILLLTEGVRSSISTLGQEEIWVKARSDGMAYIGSAALAPHGTYRLYGSSALVDEIITGLRLQHGGDLIFADYATARDALDAACAGRLADVDADGMAA